jgi:hypothetical protein
LTPQSPELAEPLARRLCAARGRALAEWGFGFSLLLQNLIDSNQACLDAADLAEARGLAAEADALRAQVLRSWERADADWPRPRG